MPAGLPYFAWIDPSETTFTSFHLRWDEAIFSFTLTQSEGDPASLTLVVRRPRNSSGDPIGLLGPGRKIWAWFALDCGADLIRFRGRLVGIPTSLFEELVTLEFVARPIDLVPQKAALAATLRVLPHYDEVVIDPARRTDPEVVLEGYSKIWHYDRETHLLTVSDEITGEDGLVEFDGTSETGKVLYDGLSLTLTSGPLASVQINAEYAWTQMGQGTVDLTRYIFSHWTGTVGTFTFGPDQWPKVGASLGDGWQVAESSVVDPGKYETETKTSGTGSTVIFPDSSWFGPSTTTTTINETRTDFKDGLEPLGSIHFAEAPVWSYSATYGTQEIGGSSSPSLNYSFSQNTAVLVLKDLTGAVLKAGYLANRQCTETVSLLLVADVQPILTDPADGESLLINDIKSVNLSEAIDGTVPIGDPARSSYIATDRGNRSLEHLIALARANLMKRARVIEIAFKPKLVRMSEITLRKNCFLIEPRVGEATGKIIGYSVALNGSDGHIDCEVRIGCAIGRGGSQVLTAGTPTYCTIDYVGADYQQFNDRLVAFAPLDTSVGYAPPQSNPNDDGLNLLSAMQAEDVIDIPLVVEHPADEQASSVFGYTKDEATEILQKIPTRATFKLKSMRRAFSTPYELQVTDLKIPTGYDLEAV